MTCANGIVNRTPTIASSVIIFLNLCLDHLFTNFLCGYTLLFLQAWRKRFDSRVPVHSSECSSKQVCRWRKTLYRTRVWRRKPLEMKWIELKCYRRVKAVISVPLHFLGCPWKFLQVRQFLLCRGYVFSSFKFIRFRCIKKLPRLWQVNWRKSLLCSPRSCLP